MSNSTANSRSLRGSAMVQWCIAALPLLLLGSMAIEVSHWHTTRQRLALSVQRATEAAALRHGTIDALAQQLKKNLPKDLDFPVKVCITDPVNALMADFIDKHLSRSLGVAVIRHNHVLEQHRQSISRGRRNGLGPRSQKTIFEANQLNVQVTVRYRALSPWVRKLIDPVTIRLDHLAIMQSHRQRPGRPCSTIN
ncbi:TadE/TadG family type IV pilus assembly protein [Orrella daihaiensis]|uniref:Tad domain-containing protein n=1 Tax=Orrella daihaiensis TaxID=2782176 RepID=A0ABY4AKF9_9BURK|nr:Tad domain-containing protein [Orrella daihaiensis]UOD49552.1 Tad domain-containing protein [Orrella daihaiensis]